MKEIKLEDVFKARKNPDPRQYVEIDQDIAHRARASLDKMFELEKLAKRQLATG